MSPVSDTIDFGSDYIVACDNGYTASSTEAMNCTADGTLDLEHTCDSKPVNYLPLFLLKIFTFKIHYLYHGGMRVCRLNCTFWGNLTYNIPSVNTCSKPYIENGTVSPASDTVDFGSYYTVTCDNGYTASSTEAMNCTANGTLDVQHTCDSKPINYLSLFY